MNNVGYVTPTRTLKGHEMIQQFAHSQPWLFCVLGVVAIGLALNVFYMEYRSYRHPQKGIDPSDNNALINAMVLHRDAGKRLAVGAISAFCLAAYGVGLILMGLFVDAAQPVKLDAGFKHGLAISCFSLILLGAVNMQRAFRVMPSIRTILVVRDATSLVVGLTALLLGFAPLAITAIEAKQLAGR